MYSFKWEADNSVPDSCLVCCSDDITRDDDSSQVCTLDPPACASAMPGEELALGAATPRESHQLRMEAVLDKLHMVSAPKWCSNYSGSVRPTVLDSRSCTDYCDVHSGDPSAKVSSLETQPQGLGGANAQVVCNSLEMSAHSEILVNIASLPDLTSSTTLREISLGNASSNCGVKQEESKIHGLPYHGPEVAPRRVDLKHVKPTTSDFCQLEAASAGSIGHPHFCAQACKYVKRTTGCRDGKQCPNCHLCFWQRTKVALQAHATMDQHPGDVTRHGILESTSLSEPMKIDLLQRENFDFETATRLLSGAHFKPCFHTDYKAVPKLQQQTCPEQQSVSTPDWCPSVGSLNHPHSCGLPCKYAGKTKGCKDGYLCPRCHECKWNRYLQVHGLVLRTSVIHCVLKAAFTCLWHVHAYDLYTASELCMGHLVRSLHCNLQTDLHQNGAFDFMVSSNT